MDSSTEERYNNNLMFQSIVLVSLSRIYDVLLIIATNLDPENTTRLLQFHEEGRTHMPPPAVRTNDE